MARQARINIMLEDHVRERLEVYAKSQGLTLSALGAFILGQYVYQQDMVMTVMANRFGQTLDSVMENIQTELPKVSNEA